MLRSFLKRLAPGRSILLILGAVGVVILFLGLALLARPARTESAPARDLQKREFDVAVEDSRKVAGFVESYGREIDETRRRLEEREGELKALRTSQEKFDATIEALRTELSALLARDEKEAANRKKAEGESSDTSERENTAEGTSLGRIQKVTLASGRRASEERNRRPSLHIPAGSFGEGTLLTGVYAPIEGGAVPVTIRLDLALVGPNRSRVPIQECLLIGKATGEANSRRVVVQLSKLSFVKTGGQTIEVPANGYVVDDDGVMGLGGRYVWRAQEILGLAVVSGGFSAMADAAAQSETTTQITPLGGAQQIVTGDVGKFGLFRGGSRAAQELEKVTLRRIEEVVPAIYVPNGKKVTVNFLDGVTLEGLWVKELKNATATNPYAGLDLDR